ncbi:hypothetical protein PO909_003712 [Leuciscus waleckii]
MPLSLACSRFRDIGGDDNFKNQAHFLWLESVACWKNKSSHYKQLFWRYTQCPLVWSVGLSTNAAHLVMLGGESEASSRAFIQKPSTLDFAVFTACRSVLMS